MRRWLLVLSIWTVMLAALASPPREIAATLERLQQDPALKDARIGILVQSLDDGAVWYAQQESELFIPASTAKLVTAALALEYLNDDYRFTTTMLTDGAVTDGVLIGNLYLRGGGDPTLTPADLRLFAQELAEGDATAGRPLHAIRGRIFLDNSFFPNSQSLRGLGWEREDLPWYYAAPPSVLSCNENAVRVTVRAGLLGESPTVETDPPTGLFIIANTATTGTVTPRTALRILPGKGIIRVIGALAPGQMVSERVSMQHPDRFFVEQWRTALRAAGISLRDDALPVSAERRILLEHRSTALAEIITRMLKTSDNHAAEQVRLALLALYSLEPPLDSRYPIMVTSYCTLSDIVMGNFTLVDGSGLSRRDVISPRGAVRILVHMARGSQAQTYFNALPIAGRDGTLKSRMTDSPAYGVVHAKTGTMTGVSSLAGYVTTRAGEHLVFAVFLNGYHGKATAARRLQDAIAGYLAAQ